MTLRQATSGDFAAIFALDPNPQMQASRADFVRRSIRSADCLLAIEEGEIIAYGVLDYAFFGQGYISMLFVHPAFRRRGVASDLVRGLEAACTTQKLFTSTNRSNAAMQAFLLRMGFMPSGVVENLDEGDPELIFFKHLHRRAA